MPKKKFWWIILIIWMALIFIFSAQTAVQSDAMSSGLVSKIAHVFIPQYDHLSESERLVILKNGDVIIRKLAHFFIYFVFSLMFLSVLDQYKFRSSRKYLLSLLICLLYALTDEWHQVFVAGRGPGLLDVGIDFLGILVGLGVFALRMRKKKNK